MKHVDYNVDSMEQHMASLSIPSMQSKTFIVGHYYIQAIHDIRDAADHIASHQTTAVGTHHTKTLLGRCTGKVLAVQYGTSTCDGVISIGFPVEMFGSIIRSADILHILSGAVQHDEARHQFIYLHSIDIPTEVVRTFPGPKFGTSLFSSHSGPRIGTIIKPCTGITEKQYRDIVQVLWDVEGLTFIKEDENFFPDFSYCPLKRRLEVVSDIMRRTKRNIIFAPHITSSPRELLSHIDMVAEYGLHAVMYSETYYGGMIREAREYIDQKKYDIAIYAHNGGIGVKSRAINRLIIDWFSRLDGGDLRQTAPTGENTYLRPLRWQRGSVEEVLTSQQERIRKTICVRAGGLDQGNLLQNLYECKDRFEDYLFLMGSAINSITNSDGEVDARIGIQGVQSVLSLFQDGVEIKNVNDLLKVAKSRRMKSLEVCIRQRYH